MKKLIEQMNREMEKAFLSCGYDGKYAKITLSNRPDLCEYQCNGAMAAAKEYRKAPFIIAQDVAARIGESEIFSSVDVVKPGFLNIKVKETYLADYLCNMKAAKNYGDEQTDNRMTIIVDYGGANIAKPLHVGHLRSAIIGESIKRMGIYSGHRMIGDIHMGDWGLQMGLIITELSKRQPELAYFDADYEGEYPKQPPFTIADLEEIYPSASKKSKEDEDYKELALRATYELQQGRRGYRALWEHIVNVSVADLRKNYEKLNVAFDLWKGEADAQPYIAPMVQKMKDDGYAHVSDGALVVDVGEEADAKEIPPCMILKSDGASLYTTTDLATIVQRMEDYQPEEIVYLTDKRQEMHFVQVFRCARKTGLVPESTKLRFLGFGTMNGKDGKPFKTREGSVMRLSDLIQDIYDEMYRKITENQTMGEEEAKRTAEIIALSALKYGDLSNQASKDYIFDMERFTSFEGNTGPYLLYTIVRMKSILKKYDSIGSHTGEKRILPAVSESEKALMLEITRFIGLIAEAFEELAPHRICAYLYDLANAFNRFYHNTKIIAEQDLSRQAGYIGLLELCKGIMETCIGVLGFSAPERM